MAQTQTASTSAVAYSPAQVNRAMMFAVLTWLVPGLGYFLLKKWIRGSLVAVSVLGMFFIGLLLQGHLYGFNLGDILDILGWIGDFCNGALYFVSRLLGGGAGNPFTVMGDYGTKFLIASGLLNILAAADVRDLALGRKQ